MVEQTRRANANFCWCSRWFTSVNCTMRSHLAALTSVTPSSSTVMDSAIAFRSCATSWNSFFSWSARFPLHLLSSASSKRSRMRTNASPLPSFVLEYCGSFRSPIWCRTLVALS